MRTCFLHLSTRESRWIEAVEWSGSRVCCVPGRSVPPELLPRTPLATPAGYVFVTVGVITLGGFWLRMIVECALSKDIRPRALRLALVALPLFFGALIFLRFCSFTQTRKAAQQCSLWMRPDSTSA